MRDIIDTTTPKTDSRTGVWHTLKVHIEGSPGRWEAICLDYDIAVQGETLDGVIESMKTVIGMYLEKAYELPAKERAALLRRRAPWSVRFGFFAQALISNWTARRPSNGTTRAEFLIPCPA